MFSYRIVTEEGRAIVQCEGDIDIDASEVIEEDIQPALQSFHSVSFDFEQVYFVDSSGIGLIIQFVTDLKNAGTTVRIEKVRPEVVEVFELLQIDEILGKDTFA